jgi:hypothetical protein
LMASPTPLIPDPTAETAPPAIEPADPTTLDTVGARASEILPRTQPVAIFLYSWVGTFLGPSLGGFLFGVSPVWEEESATLVFCCSVDLV